MLQRPLMPYSLRLPAVLAAVAVLVLPAAARATPAAATPCTLPSAAPLWIDYGDALSTDVRDVLARPGVIVTSGGNAVSSYFRAHGAATTYFDLHLPAVVGEPATPADPASIPAAATKLLAQAVAAAGCSTPQIALNELLGSNLAAPWSATNSVYRADVLALMQGLAAGGGYPVLLVHGDYTVAGAATTAWWQQVAQAGEIVYEAYYDAPHIYSLGPLMGNRRMRLGIRGVVSDFGAIGIPPARLGVMLGFHTLVQPGIAGREGLEPREAWLRVVKWEALAARQVASETGLASVWSWGWGNLGAPLDPDKASAACVHLWTRDPTLCDGISAGGPAFNSSLVEGQIVLPSGIACSLPDHRIPVRSVRELAAVTRSEHDGLTALFARASLETAAFVGVPQVLAIERQAITRSFHGSRPAYLAALHRRHATVAIARGIITDELRRHAIGQMLMSTSSSETVLQWTDDREATAAADAICLHDKLPGTSGFPASDALEIGVVPLPSLLPFLFADRIAPSAPAATTATPATGAVALAWDYGSASDLAGYEVFRAAAPTGPFTRLGKGLLDRPAEADAAAPAGVPSYYEIRAVDTSGNVSAPSAPVAATPGP
jgi:hypothetical protein